MQQWGYRSVSLLGPKKKITLAANTGVWHPFILINKIMQEQEHKGTTAMRVSVQFLKSENDAIGGVEDSCNHLAGSYVIVYGVQYHCYVVYNSIPCNSTRRALL